MSKIRLFRQLTAHVNVLLAAIVLLPVAAFGRSSVGRNTNVVGPTPDGFFSQYLLAGDQSSRTKTVPALLKAGIAGAAFLMFGVTAIAQTFVTPAPNVNLIGSTPNPDDTYNIADFGLKQQQEPSCVVRPSNPAYIMCAYNDLRASDKPPIQGDSWIGYSESGDNGLTWRSYLVPGYKSHPTNSVQNVGFAADPSLVAIPGSYSYTVNNVPEGVDSPGITVLNYIGANRDSNVGVLVAQRFVDNEQEDQRHNLPEDGHFIIADGSSGRFIDKPAFLFVPKDPGAQSYIQRSITVEGRESPVDVSVVSGTLVVAYAVFTGSSSVKVYVQTSVDLGETWSNPTKLSESLNEVTGVSLSAIGQKVSATWRQKADTNNPDAIMSAVSKNPNLTAWTKPKEVFQFCPFDQPATGVSFRSFAFPWTANDGNRFWTFAADRRFDADGGESTSCDPIADLPGTYDGIPRIVGMSSTDGINWIGGDSANPNVPFIVDANIDTDGKPLGFQVMPSAVGTKGRIDLAWYDTRRESLGLLPQGDGSPGAQIPLIYDYTSNYTDANGQQVIAKVLRKADVWMTRLNASGCGSSGACAPSIQAPVRVSQYPVAFAPSNGGTPYATPLEVEAHLPNHRLYASGTLAFKGDYIAIETPRLRKTVSGAWVNNSMAVDAGSDLVPSALEDVFVAWGDNRDVRVDYDSPFFPSTDDGQVPYTPPGGPAQGASAFKLGEIEAGASEPLVQVDAELKAVTESDDSEDPNTPPDNTLSCAPGQDFSRSRDSNIYGSLVADAPSLVAPTTTKPLGTIQRMFPLVLNNPETTSAKNFCLVIANQPEGAPAAARASFFQLPAIPPFDGPGTPPPLTRLPVTVGPASSESRAIFVFADPTDVIRVDAYEYDPVLDPISGLDQCAEDLSSDTFTGGTLQNSIFISDGGLLDPGYCDTVPTPDACLPTAIEETHNISLASLNLQAPVIKAAVTQALNLQAPALGALNLQALNLQAETLAALNLQALNLQALNLQALNLQAPNLQALNLQAPNLQALNLQALNLQALNLQALNLQALNLQALNLQAPSLGAGTPQDPVIYPELKSAVVADNVYYQDTTYFVNTDANVATTYSADIALDVSKLKTDPENDEDPVVQLIAWTPNSVNSAGTEDAGCGQAQQGFQAQVLAFTTLDALNLQALDLPETVSPDNQNPYASSPENPYQGTISFTGKPDQKIGLTVRMWATGGTKAKLDQLFAEWVLCMNDPLAADDPEFCSNEGVGQVIKLGASSQSCATSDKIDPNTGEPLYDDSDCLNDDDEKIRPDIEPPIVDPVNPPDGFDPPTLPYNLDPDLDEITITWPITATDEDFNSLEFACSIGGVDIGGPTGIELVGPDQDQLSATFEYSFSVGPTPVSCTVTDSSGNATTVTFNVEVFDVTAPDLTVPSGVVEVNADSVTGTAAPDLEAGVSATDVVDADVAISCTADPYPLVVGPNTVNCTANDDSGNESTASYTITVNDVTVPTISVPASFSVNADPISGTASPVLETGVSASDNDEVATLSCSASPYPLTIAANPNLVTCTAADVSGNESTATYTITVLDVTAPILTVPSNPDPVEADPLTGTATVTPVQLLAGVSATDNVDVVSLSCSSENDPLTVGPNTITCTASDGVNVTIKTYTITVVDVTAPTITVPADFSVSADANTGTASPVLNENVLVFDAVDTDLVATCTAVTYPLPIGANLISCTATDTAGNTTTPATTYTITVVDAIPPTVNVADRTVYVDYANMTYPYWGIVGPAELSNGVTVTDSGVDITSSANISCARDVPPEQPTDPLVPTLTSADFEFSDMPYSITCTGTDLAGNDGSASFLLTVSYRYDIELILPKGRAKAGSTIPIDVQYSDWEPPNLPVDGSAIPVSIFWTPVSSCNDPEPNGVTGGDDSGDSKWRYIESGMIWQYSWQTKDEGLVPGDYLLIIAPPGAGVLNATDCVTLR